jgi:hypothetical protein
MTTRPVVCTLTPAALRARREGALASLLGRAESREELPDGLRLRLSPEDGTLSAIAGVIEAERQCCRFLRFRVTVEPDAGPVVLELSGPPGTAEFLSALLNP